MTVLVNLDIRLIAIPGRFAILSLRSDGSATVAKRVAHREIVSFRQRDNTPPRIDPATRIGVTMLAKRRV
jgi:hypothetical protein